MKEVPILPHIKAHIETTNAYRVPPTEKDRLDGEAILAIECGQIEDAIVPGRKRVAILIKRIIRGPPHPLHAPGSREVSAVVHRLLQCLDVVEKKHVIVVKQSNVFAGGAGDPRLAASVRPIGAVAIHRTSNAASR